MPTPGVRFILAYSPHIIAPYVSAYALRYGLQRFLNIALSLPIALLSVTAFFPFALITSVVWAHISETREAAAMGAVPLPQWEAKWPGHIDRIVQLLSMKNGYPGEGLIPVFEKYNGTFNMRMLWRNQISTTDPDHIKTILNTDFDNYEKGNMLFQMMENVLGTGVFNSDGEMWKFHRYMTRPFFHRDQITHFEYLDKVADSVMTHIKERMRPGHAIDFQDLVSRFTMDASTTFLFGACVNSLSSTLPYPHNVVHDPIPITPADAFSEAFVEAQTIISERSLMGPLWPLTEMFADRTEKHMKVINAFVEPIVKQAVEKRRMIGGTVDKEKMNAVEEGETLLDHLAKYTDDTKVLKDEVLNILLASRDTTASTLTFTTYMLSQHPEILARLRKEILDTVGHRTPTYSEIKEMKFLRAVVNETLRLYPPLPKNFRQSIKAGTLKPLTPGGKPLYVPPKTVFTYAVLFMHRRKDLWGPDADIYDPDRFLDHRLHKYLIPKPHIFLPFNSGARICLGQQFAYNQASFLLVRLLQTFDRIELDPEAQPPASRPPAEWKTRPGRERLEKIRPKVHITTYALGGLWLRMREAEDRNAAED